MKFKQNPDFYIPAMVHVDEKTPHMHLCVVPSTADGRLSAKVIAVPGTKNARENVCLQRK